MSSIENERSTARTRAKPAVWSKWMSEPFARTIEPCERMIEPCERTSECERTNKPFLHRTVRTCLKNVLCEDRLAKSLNRPGKSGWRGYGKHVFPVVRGCYSCSSDLLNVTWSTLKANAWSSGGLIEMRQVTHQFRSENGVSGIEKSEKMSDDV